MKQVDDAINKAISNLNIDDLKVTKEQIDIIKENINKKDDEKIVDEIVKNLGGKKI